MKRFKSGVAKGKLCRLALARAITASYSLFLAYGAGSPAVAGPVIDWVTVGDAGNAADTTGYGNVAYEYRIMKYEFTNALYVNFLNAVDPQGTNPNAIYNANMSSDARGGISFTSGNANGSKYAVKTNMGDKPVNYVSWADAARVANWLENGALSYAVSSTGSSAPQNFGAYQIGDLQWNGQVFPAKNAGATYWVPTENEWYKAAYYKGGSTNAGYWLYPTQSDAVPTRVTANEFGVGSAGATGNFANSNGIADWNGQDGNVTTVGSNGGPSVYGAFDMGGNVYEWNSLAGTGGTQAGHRGGTFATWSGTGEMRSVIRATPGWAAEPAFDSTGFRLATVVVVPEPSTSFLALAGACGGAWSVWRRRKSRPLDCV